MNQHQHSLRYSATRHVGHDKKMTTNHSASPAPASITASKSLFSLFLWTAVAIIRLAYLYCNHLFAGLLQTLSSSGRAATNKITEVCASSASRATTTASGTAGAAHGAATARSHRRRRKSSASVTAAAGSGGACTLLTRILRGALVLSIFQARGTHAEDAALFLSVGSSTSVNFLNFLQTTSTARALAHDDDAAGMCRLIEEDISHDSAIIMPRLIPDGILTEGKHGNTVEIPSAQQVRLQGLLNFTIEEDEEVSIYYI